MTSEIVQKDEKQIRPKLQPNAISKPFIESINKILELSYQQSFEFSTVITR